ncbi:MAG: DUF2892 domain-containing protein [Salibacteraceae bacterium]
MKKNLGSLDRILRLSFAVIVAILYWQGFIGGTLAIVLGIVGIVLAATSFISYCPIYGVLGIRSILKKVSAGK